MAFSAAPQKRSVRGYKRTVAPMPEVKNAKPKTEIYNPLQCPCCKKQTMQTIMRFNRRGPPARLGSKWLKILLECLA